LLLKFLDARDMLSVQVHLSDLQTDYLPAGEHGKTEAWVVLEAEPKSRIYAGLKPRTTANDLRQALANRTLADHLASFTPTAGDSIFLQAGTVHALGGGLMVFEVQENSDVTFRLYDWDRVDAKTGQARELQIDQAIACIDFARGPVGPVTPVEETAQPVLRERLFDCEHFELWRWRGEKLFMVGAAGAPRVLVSIAGAGQLEHSGGIYDVSKGDVLLLPAAVGVCSYQPRGAVSILEIAIPGAA
jgi:mannose-6-phosphate isomerase